MSSDGWQSAQRPVQGERAFSTGTYEPEVVIIPSLIAGFVEVDIAGDDTAGVDADEANSASVKEGSFVKRSYRVR